MNTLHITLSDAQLAILAGLIAERISIPEPSNPGGLVSISDVCDRLDISRTTVYQMRKRGELKAVQIGGNVRFREEDVNALVEK